MTTPVERWVEEQARLFEPRNIYWCDGTEGEARRLIETGMSEEHIGRNDIFRELNHAVWPKSSPGPNS
jgi:GTP-dependent phosphoenolpyruvate carboxykinase